MKNILFLIALFVSSVLGDIYTIVDEENIDIKTKTKVMYYNQDSSFSERSDVGKNLNTSFNRREIKNYLDIQISDVLKISSTVGYYNNGREYNKDKDLGEIWLTQDRSNMFIEKLFAQVTLAEIEDFRLSFAYGIIPLTGGNFKKFSNQDEIQGNGLFTLIDLNLQGGFLVLSNENHILKIGKNYWKKDNWQHDEKLIEANDGTEGIFTFYEYSNDKHTLELNYITADVKYKGLAMGDAQLFGLGYSYNDLLESGFVYYGILGYSIWNSKFKDVLNSGVFGSATNTIKWANTNLPEQYDFDNDTQKGSSVLLGTKYYTELFGYETDVGFEYFKTSKNWSSFNNGSLFYNDYGFWRRRGSDIYTIYTDFKFTKNLIASMKLSYVDNGYTAKNGSIADTTALPATNNFYKSERNVLFKLSYEF